MMTNTSDWATNCVAGTVVMFHFPVAESAYPGKARPCLVIATSGEQKFRHLTLAYGTTATTDANRGLDLEIVTSFDCAAVGLHHPSRFVLSRRITVPVKDARFSFNRDQTAVIGMLPETLQPELATLIGRVGTAMTADCHRGEPPRHERSTNQRRRTHLGLRRRGREIPTAVIERRVTRRISERSASAC